MSGIPVTPTSSLGGVGFYFQGDANLSIPDFDSDHVLVITHYPYSDVDEVQDLGKIGAQTLDIEVYVNNAAWSAFYALGGRTVSYIRNGGPARSVYVKSVKKPKQTDWGCCAATVTLVTV